MCVSQLNSVVKWVPSFWFVWKLKLVLHLVIMCERLLQCPTCSNKNIVTQRCNFIDVSFRSCGGDGSHYWWPTLMSRVSWSRGGGWRQVLFYSFDIGSSVHCTLIWWLMAPYYEQIQSWFSSLYVQGQVLILWALPSAGRLSWVRVEYKSAHHGMWKMLRNELICMHSAAEVVIYFWYEWWKILGICLVQKDPPIFPCCLRYE